MRYLTTTIALLSLPLAAQANPKYDFIGDNYCVVESARGMTLTGPMAGSEFAPDLKSLKLTFGPVAGSDELFVKVFTTDEKAMVDENYQSFNNSETFHGARAISFLRLNWVTGKAFFHTHGTDEDGVNLISYVTQCFKP